MNAGSRVDHNQFCVNDHWEKVRDARGRDVRHHLTWELILADGTVLRTRISRPLNTQTYGANLWKVILRDQLAVTEDQFWSCVRDDVRPARGADTEPPPNALPAQLVWQLIHQAEVFESDIAGMTLQQAVDAMARYWAAPKAP